MRLLYEYNKEDIEKYIDYRFIAEIYCSLYWRSNRRKNFGLSCAKLSEQEAITMGDLAKRWSEKGLPDTHIMSAEVINKWHDMRTACVVMTMGGEIKEEEINDVY